MFEISLTQVVSLHPLEIDLSLLKETCIFIQDGKIEGNDNHIEKGV